MSSLPEICKPCPVPDPVVLVDKLPDVLCPCPEEPAKPSLLPTVRVNTFVTSCLKDALYAMTTQYYCDLDNGPKGCR